MMWIVLELRIWQLSCVAHVPKARQINIQHVLRLFCLYFCVMVFNATFSNILVISLMSVLMVEETGVSGENHRPVASHWQTLSHYVVHLTLIEIRIRTILEKAEILVKYKRSKFSRNCWPYTGLYALCGLHRDVTLTKTKLF